MTPTGGQGREQRELVGGEKRSRWLGTHPPNILGPNLRNQSSSTPNARPLLNGGTRNPTTCLLLKARELVPGGTAHPLGEKLPHPPCSGGEGGCSGWWGIIADRMGSLGCQAEGAEAELRPHPICLELASQEILGKSVCVCMRVMCTLVLKITHINPLTASLCCLPQY